MPGQGVESDSSGAVEEPVQVQAKGNAQAPGRWQKAAEISHHLRRGLQLNLQLASSSKAWMITVVRKAKAATAQLYNP